MLLSGIIKKKFDAVLGRYNGYPACYYFSPKDFPEIKAESFDIEGSRNVTLKGYFYYYGEFCPDRLLVFDHGIGAGHLAYFREIELLARNGYTVYSYDHTGCADSEGDGILGFAQGVNDLDRVLNALTGDPRFEGRSIRLMGHSWGGYSCMNAAQFHPEVTHVVSLAGFFSARALIEQYLPKFVMRYSDEVMDREREINPKYADLNAADSMKKSAAKLMHIQSTDDKKVHYDLCYVPLSEALAQRPDTVFITVENRNHSPQCTDAAAIACTAVFDNMEKLIKKKKLNTEAEQKAFRDAQDWNAVTEQDPKIWKRIFDFLEK